MHHNTKQGKRQGFHRPSRGSQANNRNHHGAGLVTLDIPTSLADAVNQAEHDRVPHVRLRARGSRFYMSVGRALVIVHKDDTVTLDSVVLPFQPGSVERTLKLRPENLREGDHYEVISIHKCFAGVWFVRQPAMGYHPKKDNEIPARHYFPMIRDHLLGDRQRGELLLRQLTTYTGIKFDLEDMIEHQQYVELPLGVYHDLHQLVNDERVEACKVLRQEDIEMADDLITFMQGPAGYVMPPGTTEVADQDPAQVSISNATVGPRFKEHTESLAVSAATHAKTVAPAKPVVRPVTERPAWMGNNVPAPKLELGRPATADEQTIPWAELDLEVQARWEDDDRTREEWEARRLRLINQQPPKPADKKMWAWEDLDETDQVNWIGDGMVREEWEARRQRLLHREVAV